MAPPTKLLNKDFFLLWQGQFVSQIGSQAFAIAMMFWIKHETGSATLMGALMMASQIPSVLLGPVAGVWADSHSRKAIIVWCDALNGLAVLTLAGLLFLWPTATDTAIVWLFGVSVLVSTISAFFRPAIAASIPDLVPEAKVAAANSMNQFSIQLSGFLGMGSGGVLFRVLGAPVLFLIDGLSYIFSAISESFITIPQEIPERTRGLVAAFRKFRKDFIDGLRYVWGQAGLKSLFLIAAVLNFFLGPIGVLLPFYVEDYLHATPDWFGFMMAAFGVGAMVGYVAAGSLRPSGRVRAVMVIGGIILMAAFLASYSVVRSTWLAVTVSAAVGLCNGFVNINIVTIIQLTTPSGVRGRTMGLLGTLTGGLMPISMGLTGVITDLVDQNVPLMFAISGGTTTIIAALTSVNRHFRQFLAYEPPPRDIPEDPPGR
jgi:MFS family permease